MINVKVDTTEFNKALKQAILTSSRSASRVVDGQALALASRSMKHTAKASRIEIAHVLGQVGNKLRKRRKDGRFVKGANIYKQDSYAARIINAKRRKEGKPLVFGAEMNSRVKKFIGARLRSVGFISSGWKWAVMDLVRRVKAEDIRRGAKPDPKRPKFKRRGKAEQRGTMKKPKVRIFHEVTTPGASNVRPVAEAGLRAGLRETVIDMKKHMEKRLRKNLKKYNAR